MVLELKHVLLLTGVPGVGKTTIIKKVSSLISGRKIQGFTTEEIREKGERKGFRIETFNGDSAVMAHVDIPKTYRVGKYGVDIAALENIVNTSLRLEEKSEIFFIDEIGKMECFSERFIKAVTALLDSKYLLVATIAARGRGFIESVKRRSDVEIWEVTRDNREDLPWKILHWIEDRD
jgi:nucleoside-triphosphatase